VLNDQDFRLEDIKDTRWDWINQQLGDDESNGVVEEGPWVDAGAGWTQETLQLTVPFHKRMTFPGNRMFQAGTFYRRSITAILRERLTGPDSCHFHYDPYELYWQPDLGRVPIRVFGELYTSPEFIRVHHELQASPPEPGCNLPRVVVGLLFSSDVTHLTQFGDAKLWPVYLFFGNDSKYRRCKPSCRLCNHLAYLQTVSRCGAQCMASKLELSPSSQITSMILHPTTVGKPPRRRSKHTATGSCSTNNGKLYSTMSLWRHIGMASLSHAPMGTPGASTHGSLLT